MSPTLLGKEQGFPERGHCPLFGYYVCVSCSVVSDSATPWTVAYQAPLSKGFSRQEYWSGAPFPSALAYYSQAQNCHGTGGEWGVSFS